MSRSGPEYAVWNSPTGRESARELLARMIRKQRRGGRRRAPLDDLSWRQQALKRLARALSD